MTVDSWDGEYAQLELDGTEIWSESIKSTQSGHSGNVCGNGWNENFILVEEVGANPFHRLRPRHRL